MKRLLILAALCFYSPVAAKAVIFDFTGFVRDRDQQPLGGRGITYGSQVNGFVDLDLDRLRPDEMGPTVVDFQIFAGSLHGYSLDSPADYIYENAVSGEWVESGDQRNFNPDDAHHFMFIPSFNLVKLKSTAGVYSFNEHPLDGIPEFLIHTTLTERQLPVADSGTPDQPVPEPSTIALCLSGLLLIRRKLNEKIRSGIN